MTSRLEQKIRTLVEDIGLERVLEDNDLTEEELLEHLYNVGLLDMQIYFPKSEETEEE